MSLSDLIALVELYYSKKNDKATKERENYIENNRQKEIKEQIINDNNKNRIALMPNFQLTLNEKIFVKKTGEEEYFILPVSLINIGQKPATNIMIETMTDDGDLKNHFRTEGLKENIHFIHGYLDKLYAAPKDTIKFSACCKRHNNAYDVFFKLRFKDLVGRIYEQEFRFQYWFDMMDEFSMNHTSDLPICIEDGDKKKK